MRQRSECLLRAPARRSPQTRPDLYRRNEEPQAKWAFCFALGRFGFEPERNVESNGGGKDSGSSCFALPRGQICPSGSVFITRVRCFTPASHSDWLSSGFVCSCLGLVGFRSAFGWFLSNEHPRVSTKRVSERRGRYLSHSAAPRGSAFASSSRHAGALSARRMERGGPSGFKTARTRDSARAAGALADQKPSGAVGRRD